MGIILYQEPKLEKPDLIASWPGIGDIGIIAIDTLKNQVQAEEFGEIEPWDFFYPRKVIIKDGILEDLRFPDNKFYYQRLEKKDLIFFTGDEQLSDRGRMYAEGKKAYQMANLVLDVAEKFGCQRIYTSGAAVAVTHHAVKPRVWTVTSNEHLLKEARSFENTILMSETEGRGERGSITGLNGLLLGLAKKRGFESICIMGEIPDYLSGAQVPYPRASKSVLEVLSNLLGIEVDYGTLDGMAVRIDNVINDIYEKFPQEIRGRIEQRKAALQARAETITEDEEKWLKEHIDDFFKKGGAGDEKPS